MSGSNLANNKTMLSPQWFPDDKSEGMALSSTLRQARHFEIVRTNAAQTLQEMHPARILALREELEYLKETEWKYQSIDKYIGQQNTYT